jgi:hypothetical protein
MQFEAKCGSVVASNGIFKILLTVFSSPSDTTEYMLLNLLKSRVEFEEGDTVEVTLKVIKKHSEGE